MTRSTTAREPRRSTAKRMIVMLLIVGLLFGAIFGFKWFGNTMMNQFMDNMPQPPATITAATARAERWTQSLDAVGTLVAVNGTQVTTEAAGVISAIRFESGEPVRRGDVLIQLDTSTELATLRSMEAGLNLAVTQRDRFRELFERNQAVARADLDQREAEAERLQAEVAAQRALIARKTIRAPFDGMLGIRRVNLGQYLGPGDPIVGLQSLDPIYLHFSLPEQRLGDIAQGQAVQVTVDSLTGRQFAGTITAIEPEVDAGTRNFLVQATLDNPEHTLRPGGFARVRAEVGNGERVIVIPQTAISFNPYGNSVYVISEREAPEGQASAPVAVRADGSQDNGPELIVRQRFVQTGATRGDLIAVTQGLEPGDRVATSGLLKLRNEAVVVISDRVEPAADEAPVPDNS